ncbi:acyltransferase family protein [Sebaldella sp. S0638]|uniref:acyltransferase family protein n=1 Tax=Sebaldella sp. S0638 TaxID=2957809 RepID=UPI0035327FC5
MFILKVRNLGIDLIKIFAITFVLGIHFLNVNHFLETPFNNFPIFFQGFLRNLFILCVPLFIMSTGYLQNQKSISNRFYKKISSFILTYCLYVTLFIIYKTLFLNIPMNFFEVISFYFIFPGIFWFFGMFIGLYLIIPFLNIIINSVTKKQFFLLIFILIFATCLQTIFESFKIGQTFWYNIFPICYYCLGAFINKYKPNIKRIHLISLLIFSLIFTTFIDILISGGNIFFGISSNYSSIFTIINSVLFFLSFYNLKRKSFAMTSFISSITLNIYLSTAIADNITYKFIFYKKILSAEKSLKYLPLAVLCSFTISFFIYFLFFFIKKIMYFFHHTKLLN